MLSRNISILRVTNIPEKNREVYKIQQIRIRAEKIPFHLPYYRGAFIGL